MQLVDDWMMPGITAVCIDRVDLRLEYLVVNIQRLPWILRDHEELDIALYNCHHAFLLLLLVVGDDPDHR